MLLALALLLLLTGLLGCKNKGKRGIEDTNPSDTPWASCRAKAAWIVPT
jgi:hypothetical protein